MNVEISDKQSSIEVDKNAKGEFSFHVKIYFNDEQRTPREIINEIKEAHDYLKEQFPFEKSK